jgi:tetratricopeptide (TPR) repeat protein
MPCRWIPSRSSARRAALVLVLVAADLPGRVAVPGSAAEAAETDATSRARELYKSGEKAFKAGRYEEALREWESGYQLSARPLFLLNMGHAERRRGQLGNARTLYRRFLLMEPETKLRGEIEGVLREIDGALATEEAGKSAAPASATPANTPPPVPAAADEHPADTAVLPSPTTLAAETTAVTSAAPSVNPSALVAAAPMAEPARPIWKKWWFWAGAGGAVALGVVGSVLLFRGDSYTKNGSIGTLGGPP